MFNLVPVFNLHSTFRRVSRRNYHSFGGLRAWAERTERKRL